MPVSKINPTLIFEQTSWFVSVLNTGDKLGGHSMLVIEGVEKLPDSIYSSLFIGQYDIKAEIYKDDEAVINSKGYISEVRCFETNKYTRDYSQYPSKTYPIDPESARKMIDSIEEDQKVCLRAAKGEGEYRKYQLVGDKHPFSEIGMGVNCASWCIEKLEIGGININPIMTKPDKLTRSCNIL